MHWHGLSLVNFVVCFKKSLLWEKIFSQYLHVKGLSPVCVLWWLSRGVSWQKTLSHWLHLHGFSNCVHSYVSKDYCSVSKFSHAVHIEMFFLLYMSLDGHQNYLSIVQFSLFTMIASIWSLYICCNGIVSPFCVSLIVLWAHKFQ